MNKLRLTPMQRRVIDDMQNGRQPFRAVRGGTLATVTGALERKGYIDANGQLTSKGRRYAKV